MANKKLPDVSPAESEVLQILWNLRRGRVQDVCAALPRNRRIAYATVQTLLRRLEVKGYIAHEAGHKAHIFYPVVERDRVVGHEVRRFLKRLFGGDAVPLMLHLAQTGRLTEGDLDRLRELIAKAAKSPEG